MTSCVTAMTDYSEYDENLCWKLGRKCTYSLLPETGQYICVACGDVASIVFEQTRSIAVKSPPVFTTGVGPYRMYTTNASNRSDA